MEFAKACAAGVSQDTKQAAAIKLEEAVIRLSSAILGNNSLPGKDLPYIFQHSYHVKRACTKLEPEPY
jgi:hypothetical protein